MEIGLALPSGSRVVDVGTGSGAIALALAFERPDLEVWGTDASADALAVAQENAERLGLDVRFEQADLLDGLSETFGAVLANLPYVVEGTPLEPEITRYSAAPLPTSELALPAPEDQALLIYTSGTTGAPKAARVTHGRIVEWSFWFAGMMNAQSKDRMYNCLPMYHSVGGVLAPGAILSAGGALVIRERFSASHFWSDARIAK